MPPNDYASNEHRAAIDFLSARNPTGRRNSIQQANVIHPARTMDAMAPANAFSSADFENMRDPRGSIHAASLISRMHPTQEQIWNPNMGQGRHQIRTGRNFSVPDRDNPGHTFNIRIHTNDNTLQNRDANAFSHAVVRIERTIDGRMLMGGESHVAAVGANAWLSPHNHNDANINAAHIPANIFRPIRGPQRG
ncbi:hypothetical protein [Burkholderia perseverans]|uniref:hypothetical protein n=1 Tax=Burkholderia perseverans TaxID=2615214 RepID=UPI001FEED41D|nr:hypothetical protein [Burkholderia perseverans]